MSAAREAATNPATSQVGLPRPRPDAPTKVRGATRYAADQPKRGLLHARLVLAQRAHARIVSIDTSAALAVPGVVAVLTAADLPITADRHGPAEPPAREDRGRVRR